MTLISYFAEQKRSSIKMCDDKIFLKRCLLLSTYLKRKLSEGIGNFAIFVIKIYQLFFSQWLGGHCRFYPSCSNYALEALNQHSFSYAFLLILKRLLKCHPLSSSQGYDPVIHVVRTK